MKRDTTGGRFLHGSSVVLRRAPGLRSLVRAARFSAGESPLPPVGPVCNGRCILAKIDLTGVQSSASLCCMNPKHSTRQPRMKKGPRSKQRVEAAKLRAQLPILQTEVARLQRAFDNANRTIKSQEQQLEVLRKGVDLSIGPPVVAAPAVPS